MHSYYALEAGKFCYNLYLNDSTGILRMSTDALDAQNDSVPYEENSRFRTYCWNITFPDHVEIRLTFDIGIDPTDRVSVQVLPNGLLPTHYLSYNPGSITSTKSPTIVQISVYDVESYASFVIEQTLDRSGEFCIRSACHRFTMGNGE